MAASMAAPETLRGMGALHSRHLSYETAASQQILSSSRIVPHPGPLLTGLLSTPLMDADNLALAQAAISVILLVAVALRPFVPRRPRWCRPFAREQDDYAVSRKTLWTRWTLYLATMAVAGLASSVASVILGRHSLPRILELVPWMAAGLITAWRRPVKTPTTLLALYLVILVCSIIPFATLQFHFKSSSWPYFVNFAISLASIFGILAMPMRDPSLLTDGIGHKDPTYTLRSPEDNLTLWTFMTVSWMAPLISRGKQRKLNDEDIWQLPFDFQHDKLHTLFRDLQGSIVRRLLQANGLDLLIISVLAILESAANLSMPLLLKKLLESMELGDKRRTTPIMFAAAILCVRLVACQSSVFSLWFSRRCYERSRGEMITTIYAKTLTRKSVGQGLPEKDVDELDESDVVDTEACQDDDAHGEEQHAKRKTRWTGLLSFLRLRRGKPGYQKIVAEPEKTKQPATTGKILNLMKSDVYEVAQRFWDFPQLIVKPLQFIVSLVLVWQLVGWPCLVGIACILVAQVLNAFFIRKVFQNERVRRVAGDERLQATSQFVEGIRHLRWYDWQSKWVDRIMDTRQRELARMVTTRLWVIGISTLNIASGALFPVATFFAYTVLAKKPLTVGIAFPALQLFTMLQSNFRDIPGLIQVLLNASIAVGRIEQFMEEPDKDEGSCDDETNQIDFKGASFAWPGTDTPVLRDLNFDLPQGLTVVFGKVGSGKTALLQAILGELDWVSGDFVIPNDMIGYCAQLPWLQHMNIRENILFSAHYDAARYGQVLDACELLPDLREFKDGDLSDMGENGIGLSGGQRARIALARAVYSQSQVLLLDDPLAALDHQTADSIVRKLLRGPLVKGRTIVLVTHRVDLCLHLADLMIEVEGGTARVLGPEEASVEAAKFMRSEEEHAATHDEEPQVIDDNSQTEAIPEKFIEEEHRKDGGVMFSVYWEYIKAGALSNWAALVIVFALYRAATYLTAWFLKSWTEASDTTIARAPSDSFLSRLLDLAFSWLPNPNDSIQLWVLAYLCLALAQTVVYVLSEGLSLFMIYRAAKSLFIRVIDKVSNATFRFYDVTPVGRLMNRLVSDIGMIDGGIMGPLQLTAWFAISWISSMGVIASLTPLFLAFSLGVSAWFVYIFLCFLPTSQSLRRLEMVSLSPLMSNFGILLDGLGTIRAFNAQPHFQHKNIAVVDAFQKMDHFYWSLQSWLMYRFDALSAVSTFALTIVALQKGFSPSLTAFVLTTASQFVEATHNLCRQYGTLQMDFVSVERVIELLSIPSEPCGTTTPPAVWPAAEDAITFNNVTLKYAPHLDPSLVDASFTIPGGSTCAVLGRTGSGKSTLALALLATMHPTEGTIMIGDYKLSDLDVHAWRQRISFVAQDPVLFPGTLRDNLDPLRQFSDGECASVLARVLGGHWTIKSRVDGGGKNLSQGQRQLVGIGRAVLRRSPLVVLDEATASIDRETAAQVQKVLKGELEGSTVVTIAHRLEAVEGADWFIKLDAGKVVESGPARGRI
ncbi:Endo-1,4-beta-xylanase I [Verticillium dahliae VDG2]|nr:Endo-1,4-beta-xylanase I [Verticillium dahliae VDG2]